MSTELLNNGGLQTVAPLQVVYLDFDGADTAYHGEALTVDTVTVQNSGLTDTEIATLTERLNAAYEGKIIFVTERPLSGDYSTVYVGATDAFPYHGLAETVDIGNQNHSDNAFVNLQGGEFLETIQQIILHEVGHLTGTLDHGGDGLAAYAFGSRYDVSSGVTSSNIILNNDSMFVSNGGTANSTTMFGGSMYIFGGGTANSTTTTLFGSVIVSSGGTANNTLITSYGKMLISGGTANSTTLSTGGTVSALSGGIANNTILNSLGSMAVFSGGSANSTILNSGGAMTVYSGGNANSNAISGGKLYISFSGSANNTVINSTGAMTVSAGGTATDITVNAGGNLLISSGGSAVNVVWTPCVGMVTVINGGYVTYQNSVAGCYFGSNNQLLSQGITMSGKVVSGSMYVGSDGVAEDITIAAGGSMYIASGGSAVNVIWTPCVGTVTVNDGGYITYQSSYSGCYFGSADVLLSQGLNISDKTVAGSMYIFSGGYADNNTVNSNGTVFISSGGSANNTTISKGNLYVSAGGAADNTIVNSGGAMTISSGGTANSTTVNSSGKINVSSGGSANSTILNSGAALAVSSGGTVNGTVINSGGYLYITMNVSACDTTINSGGSMSIAGRGSATDISINGGILSVSSGGSAVNVIWTPCVGSVSIADGGYVTYQSNYSGCYFGSDNQLFSQNMTLTDKVVSGSMFVFSNGSAGNTSITSGGSLLIFSGGSAENTTANSSAVIMIAEGGTANSTLISSGGQMRISSGGTANSTTIRSGGSMNLAAGGVANNTLLEGYGSISVSGGTIMNYVTLNDLGYLYILSGGTVNGGQLYSRSQIRVSGGTVNGAALYESGTINVSSGGTANDTVLSSGGSLFIASGGTANNTTVNSLGTVIVATGGTANSTTANSKGSIEVIGSGTAESTIVNNGGAMLIVGGGTANNTMVNDGGAMSVAVDATANNTMVNSLGVITVFFDGTVNNTTISGGSIILSGGVANSTTVYANGLMKISAEGSANYATVNSGGLITVAMGAAASNITVKTGGSLVVSSGGSATNVIWTPCVGTVTVADGGYVTYQSSYSGCYFGSDNQLLSQATTMTGTIISGSMYIADGGVASSTSVTSGGSMTIASGGSADNTTLNGGNLTVYSGGDAVNTVINNGAMTVYSGGSAIDVVWTPCVGTVTVNDGGYVTYQSSYSGCYFGSDNQLLSQAATMTGKVVSGSMYIFSGGSASDTSVKNGSMFIASGGVADRTTLSSGYLYISSGGAADNSLISSNGFMIISSGGTAHSATVTYAGQLTVSSGGSAGDTTVSGGSMTISSGGSANGGVLSNGLLTIASGGRAENIAVNLGTFTVFSGGSAVNVIWTPCVGTVTVNSGGYISYQSSYSGCYFGSNNQLLSQALTMSGKVVYGSMYIAGGGIADRTLLYSGTMTITSGGTANSTTVNGGSLDITSGGTANSTTLSRGYLYISSGGTANVTLLNYGGSMSIFSGGTANSTTLNSGSMYIANGGIANHTVITSYSYMRVSSGGIANSTVVNSYNEIYIGIDGIANDTTVNGSMSIYSATANRTIINAGGTMRTYDGAIVNSTTVNSGGTVLIYSGSVANNITVNAGGYMYVDAGGSAVDVIWTPCVGTVTVADGAYVTYQSNYSGCYLGSGNLLQSQAATMTGTVISGSMYIANGGAAESAIINPSGIMTVASGGTASNTAVNGGNLTVSSGGSAFNVIWTPCVGTVTVENGAYVTYQSSYSGCYLGSGNLLQSQAATMSGKTVTGAMYIFSGGIANNAYTNSQGIIHISSGGVANSTTIMQGFMYIYTGGTANRTNLYDDMYIYSGGVANSTTITNGYITVLAGGSANGTTISSGGRIYVSSGGVVNSTTLSRELNLGGRMYVSSGGVASNTTLNYGCSMYIASGGSAVNVVWTPFNGTLTVAEGAYVTYQSSYSGCYFGSGDFLLSQAAAMTGKVISGGQSMYIFSDGLANNTSATGGGILSIASGGSAYNTLVNSNAAIYVSRGGTANSTAINFGGSLFVSSGGIANVNSVNISGFLYVSSGGTANSTTIYGGTMHVYSGGKVTGKLAINGGASVTVDAGAEINFDVSKRTGGDSYLINNLSLIDGAPNYTITVSATQSTGIYKLAQGAAGFTQTVSIGNGSNILGSLTVNGISVTNGDYSYSLLLNSGNLSLSVVNANVDVTAPTITDIAASVTDPTNQNVLVSAVFGDDKALASSQYKIGNGEWTDYTGAVTVAAIATVYFKAVDTAGNEATKEYTVSNIDKTAPTITDIAASATDPTNQSVLVSAVFGDDKALASSLYKIGDGDWVSYTGAVSVTSNAVVYFKAVDKAGNEATAQYEVSNIDKAAPTITGIKANPTDPTNQDVAISAVFEDDTALASSQYKIGDGEWTDYSGAITVSGDATIYFRAVDTAGNEATAQYEVSNIDKTAPTITGIKANPTDPTNQDVAISAVFDDDIALALSQYKIGDGEWIDYSGAVTVSGNATVYFKAVDTAGNETTKEYRVSNIDKAAPTISGIKANTTNPTNQDVTVSAVFDDDIALALSQYKIGNGDWTNYTGSITVSGNATVYFKAVDTAGNEANAQYEVKNILNLDPKAPGAVIPTARVNKYDATISWRTPAAQDKAKIVSYEVSINGEISIVKGTSLTLKAMQISVGNTIQIRGLDSLGRYGALSDIITFDIKDVTAPTLGKVETVLLDQDTATVSWSGSDNVGVDHYQVKCGDQTQTLAETSAVFGNLVIGVNNVEVIAFDAAGNTSKAVKAKITVKDVTAPDPVTGLADPAVNSKYKATLSWSAGVDNSGSIASYEIQLDNGKILKSTKTTLAVNNLAVGQHSYQVRAIDKAKNIGEWSAAKAFTVLDTTAPDTVSVKAAVAQNSITLSWKAPADNVGVTGYQVWVGASPSTMTLEQALSADQLSCVLTDVPKGVYYMDVRAVDAANNVGATKPVKVTVSTALPVSSFVLSSSPLDLLTLGSSDNMQQKLA